MFHSKNQILDAFGGKKLNLYVIPGCIFPFRFLVMSKFLVFTHQIVLDNKAHSGKVKISLDNEVSIKECRDPSVSGHGETAC